MSEQSAKALSNELGNFCKSNLLSEDGLRELFERHGLTSKDENTIINSNYQFFVSACYNKKVNEGIIRCLLEYFPDAASATYENGWTPLHVACYNERVTEGIIQLLLEYFPDAVRANDCGFTPLHCACRNKSVTRGIIQLLIDAAPDTLRSVTSDGNLPLHVLCGNIRMKESALVEMTELLIKKYPEAVRHADNGGRLPIHIAAKVKSPGFCRVLIKAYPGSERINASNDILPLHCACWHNTVATVQYLYKLHPDAVDHATRDGLYPIHYAIMGLSKRANPEGAIETVQYLLGCDSNVKLQKWRGQPLLYSACHLEYNDSNINAALEMIKTIYDAHPEAIEHDRFASGIQNWHEQVRAFINSELVFARQAKDLRLMNTPDDNGQLPLHRALQKNAALGSIKLLVKGNPSALRTSDNNFAMPLHIACEHHDSARVVQCLLDLDMRTLRAVDIDNNTALHYACRGAKYKTIDMLLEKFDAISVSKRNAQKRLPIDLLYESDRVNDRESIEYTGSIYQLLRANPEIIMTRE